MRHHIGSDRRHGTAVALIAAVMLLLSWNTVYGAQSSVVETVTVKVQSAYGDQEEILEPVITLSGSGCSLLDIQYRTDYEYWKPGRKVRVEITVKADEGKFFPVSLNRSSCRVTGADFVSARALDDTTLQVKVDYRPIMVLGDTQKAGWSDATKKKATWRPVESAPGYTLTLYGDNSVVKRMNVETNSADLSSYMEDMDRTYYYEVKAVPLNSQEKKYLKEGNYVTSSDQEFDWQDYEKEENNTSQAWQQADGKWYYLDENGNRAKGWLYIGERWYYFDASGVMCTGWVEAGSWYYMGPDGDMKTGWLETLPNIWYYLNENGSMAVNTTVDGWTIGEDGIAYQ